MTPCVPLPLPTNEVDAVGAVIHGDIGEREAAMPIVEWTGTEDVIVSQLMCLCGMEPLLPVG